MDGADGVAANDSDVEGDRIFVASVDDSNTAGTVTATTIASLEEIIGATGTATVTDGGFTGSGNTPTTITFAQPFSVPPVIFAQPATNADSDAAVVRVSNITVNGFDMEIAETTTNGVADEDKVARPPVRRGRRRVEAEDHLVARVHDDVPVVGLRD